MRHLAGFLRYPWRSPFRGYACVRPWGEDTGLIGRALEAGANGLLVPRVGSAHPVATSVLIGVRTPAEIDDCLAMAATNVPDELWTELKQRELLREDAPVPKAMS